MDPASDLHGLLFDPDRCQDWIEAFLTIENERGKVVDFKLYPQQRKMLRGHSGRDVTVKGRQTRASSLILARNLRRLTTEFGLRALIMTQDDQTTALFRARFQHHLRDLADRGFKIEIPIDRTQEMVIGKEMQNHILWGSGEERVAGRAYAAQVVHLSEIAHWKPQNAGRLLGGITPACPLPPHGWFDLESTPNGADGEFFEYAMDARESEHDPLNAWNLHFYPWFGEPRYRAGVIGEKDCDLLLTQTELTQLIEDFHPTQHEERLIAEHSLSIPQLLWRRSRERDLMRTGVPFLQEYVEDIDNCFITGSENFFSSADGVDHLAYFKSQSCDPSMRLDSLDWQGALVSFYGPNLSIWERPDPAQRYVGYLDCAEGGQSRESDYTALVVVNAYTLHHAATLRIKGSPSECGTMTCAVMRYYNTGVLGGERGGYGSAALERIRDLRYPNVYYHLDYNRPSQQPEAWIYPQQPIRDEVLRIFREAVFERTFLTRDRALVGEMGTFGWEKTRTGLPKAKARKRKHDDMVIAAAGAVYIAQRQNRYRAPAAEARDPDTMVIGPRGLVMDRQPAGTVAQGWMR